MLKTGCFLRLQWAFSTNFPGPHPQSLFSLYPKIAASVPRDFADFQCSSPKSGNKIIRFAKFHNLDGISELKPIVHSM